MEVLRLLAVGRRNRDIAEVLDLSEKSVEVYVSRVLAELHATNRTEAVTKAYQYGLVLVASVATVKDILL